MHYTAWCLHSTLKSCVCNSWELIGVYIILISRISTSSFALEQTNGVRPEQHNSLRLLLWVMPNICLLQEVDVCRNKR